MVWVILLPQRHLSAVLLNYFEVFEVKFVEFLADEEHQVLRWMK